MIDFNQTPLNIESMQKLFKSLGNPDYVRYFSVIYSKEGGMATFDSINKAKKASLELQRNTDVKLRAFK